MALDHPLPLAPAYPGGYQDGQLHVCWPGSVGEDDLRAQYLGLLASAAAHGSCRFWLLDARARNWPPASFGSWFRTEFAQQAHTALGQPLFLAYVLDPAARAAASSPNAQATQYACAEHDVYPFFFDNELAAVAWLQHQQSLDAGAYPAAA